MYQLILVGLHQLDSGMQGIGHVHHVHTRTLTDGTNKLFAFNCRVIDVYGVVGCSTSWRCYVRDNARETHRTRVNPILLLVIVAQQFGCNFRYTIDSSRALDSVLRCHYVRRVGPERTNRTRCKHCATVLACHFQDVPQPVNANLPCQSRLALGHNRKQSGQVVDGVDVVLAHHFGNHLRICHVGNGTRSCIFQLAFGFCSLNVACHHVTVTVTFP